MLRARDIVVAFGPYGHEQIVLRTLNLNIAPGSVVGIVAAPGSGRSTLAAVLAGSLTPISGEVRLASGEPATRALVTRSLRDDNSFWFKLRQMVTPAPQRYASLAEANASRPALLVVDDADQLNPAELATCARSRGATGQITVLLTVSEKPIVGIVDSLYRLEHGQLRPMPAIAAHADDAVFQAEELLERIAATLRDAGADDDVARQVASVMLDAERRGHASHGVSLLPIYLERIAAGGIVPRAALRWEQRAQAVAVLDAGGGFGQPAALAAAEWCARAASEHGIASVAIRNNNHVGMMAAYRAPFQRHGVVGLLLNVSGPSVVSPGGCRGTLGSNAICLVTPTATGPEPFVVDFGTGVVAAGKIRDALLRGVEVPEGWLLDRHGKPSTNPADLDDGGAIPLFGGYKGLAVSVIAEVLAGMLGGGTVSPLVNKQRAHPDRPMNCSQLYIGLSPGAFGVGPLDSLVDVLEQAVGRSSDAPPAPPYFPDQVEAIHATRASRDGIELAGRLLQQLGWR